MSRPSEDTIAGIVVPFRVRFDETAPDGLVRTTALLRYAQDCAWVHSEALGFGRDWYADRGLGWLVRAIEMEVTGGAATGDVLDVSTAVIGFRRVMARRRTTIRDTDGGAVARIDTDWVMVDVTRGVPTRIPSDFPDLFGAPPGGFEPNRVDLPPTEDAAVRVSFRVRRHELDPMDHANNAAYLDWLEEAVARLPDGAARLAGPRTYRLEYLQSATPEAALVGAAWVEAGGPGVSYRLTWAPEDGRASDAARGSAGDAGASYPGKPGEAGGQVGADLLRGVVRPARVA
jgi:acyl-CoA thioester hydrolase